MVKTVSKRAEAPADAPARILAAARAEFAAKGFAGARMLAIARAAGVNHALLHYYFRSKEHLYTEAVRDKVSQIWAGIRSAAESLPGDASFRDILAALLKGHARTIAAHPEFVMFMLRDIQDGRGVPMGIAEVLRSHGEIPRRVNTAYAVEVAAGRLRAIPPAHFWLNLLGMTVSGFLASRILPRLPTDSPLSSLTFDEAFFLERAEMIADTIVASLRPAAQTGKAKGSAGARNAKNRKDPA